MYESNGVDSKQNHQSCIYLERTHSIIDHEYGKEANFRKRVHSLLSQNFKLKQQIVRLRNEAKNIQQELKQLKQHLKITLQEMVNNDKIIQTLKNNEEEYQVAIRQLQSNISALKHQLQTQKQAIVSLLDHNKNLQAQNELVISIKQKYLMDLSKIKTDLDCLKAQDQSLIKQNQLLSIQNNKLLEQIDRLQEEIQTKRNNIEEYQKFVLDKLSSVKDNQQFHQGCKQKLSNIHEKYMKYKHKSSIYKRQRDQLLFHLQHFSRQIDGDTLRKYYEEV